MVWLIKSIIYVHSKHGILYRPRSFERWQLSQYQGLSVQPAAAASLSISTAFHLIVCPIVSYYNLLYVPTNDWLPKKLVLQQHKFHQNHSKSIFLFFIAQIRNADLTAMMAIFESACLRDIGLLIAGCNSFWSLLCSNSDLWWQRGTVDGRNPAITSWYGKSINSIYCLTKALPPKKCQSKEWFDEIGSFDRSHIFARVLPEGLPTHIKHQIFKVIVAKWWKLMKYMMKSDVNWGRNGMILKFSTILH